MSYFSVLFLSTLKVRTNSQNMMYRLFVRSGSGQIATCYNKDERKSISILYVHGRANLSREKYGLSISTKLNCFGDEDDQEFVNYLYTFVSYNLRITSFEVN
jgi:hypothetical protein